MSVLSAKINELEIVFAVERSAKALRSKRHLQVDSVIDDDMESVREFLGLIRITDHINDFFFVGLENPMTLNDFPNGLLKLGEGGVLGVNFALIANSNSFVIVLENVNRSVVNFCTIYSYNWTD